MVRIVVEPQLRPFKLDVDENGLVETDVEHEFISLVHIAYVYHRELTFGPDDIWLTILQFLAENVNNNVEHYRESFGLRKEKEKIIVVRNCQKEDLDNPYVAEDVFNEFISIMQVQNAKIADFQCDFSTTTVSSRLCSQVSLAHMMRHFYMLKVIAGCGFPAINIEGTAADWKNIKKKIDKFRKVAHASLIPYLDKCKAVIDKILTAYSFFSWSKVDWKQFYYIERCGSGGDIGFKGFILDILNVPIRIGWEPNELSSMRTSYQFCVAYHSGEETVTINVGPKKIDSDLKMKYDHMMQYNVKVYQIGGTDIEYEKINLMYFSKITFDGIPLVDIVEMEMAKVQPDAVFPTDQFDLLDIPDFSVYRITEHFICAARFDDGLYFFEITKNGVKRSEMKHTFILNQTEKIYPTYYDYNAYRISRQILTNLLNE